MSERLAPVAPDGLPLLLDRLRRNRCPDGTAYLTINVWCPACRRRHTHSWNLECGLTGIGHRTPHCPTDSPYRPAGYWIALDPTFDGESRRLLKRVTGEDYP